MKNCLAMALPLADLKTGERAIFLNVSGGKGVTYRLASMGFTPGVEVEMIQNYGRGPIMVLVRGTRVALGRREAEKTYCQRNRS